MEETPEKQLEKLLSRFVKKAASFQWSVERYHDWDLAKNPRPATDQRHVSKEIRALQQWLAVEAGSIEPIVSSLVGPITVSLTGNRWNPWDTAYRYDISHPAALISIRATIEHSQKAIGLLRGSASRELVKELTRTSRARPQVAILHDGDSDYRTTLERELWYLGLDPRIVEDQPSKDESVDAKVDRVLGNCTFAVLLGRASRGNNQDGTVIPRGNLIDELGRVRRRFGDNYLILLESPLTLPSNQATGVVWETYTSDTFDKAILKTIRKLRDAGII